MQKANGTFTQPHFYQALPGRSGAGFSTLELMIAFVVITLSLSAVILVAFGNQSIAIDTELAQRATYLAERNLEVAAANAMTQFDSLVDSNDSEAQFTTSVTFTPVSECVQEVASTVMWKRGLRDLSTTLTSLLTSASVSEILGGDCDTAAPSTDWDNPEVLGGNTDLSPSGVSGTDLDVVKRGSERFAVLTAESLDLDHSDLWIFDVNDPGNPSLLSALNLGQPLTVVDASGEFAFVGSTDPTGQFKVIRFTDPANPSKVASKALPGVDPSGSYPAAISIYYYNEHVYIGTAETGGPEFHIYRVSNPSSPEYLGSLELNHNVHDIVVRGDYAYIASSGDGCELIIVDVSNPNSMDNPCPPGTSTGDPYIGDPYIFDAPEAMDGTALYLLGDTLYLGRERKSSQSSDDFFVLNISDPAAVTEVGSARISLNPNTEITGIVVRGNDAFLTTSKVSAGFQVWDLSDPTALVPASSCNELNYAERATALDFVDGYAFVVNESNDALTIIHNSPAVCI